MHIDSMYRSSIKKNLRCHSLNLFLKCTRLSTDFTCKRFTIDGDVQLREDDTIMVTANSLQSIVCKNNTSEISDIAYNFNPPNAAVRSSEVYYIPPHKYEKKFFLDSSATLMIRGINSTNNNDANYTLEINFQVVQGIQE